jgi:Zn-dependent M28 family amino/carboxypeptidase
MTRPALIGISLLLASACSSAPPTPPAVAEMPAINTDAVVTDIRKLSSDEFEGRAPGTRGEALTVQYLIDQFKTVGAEPGNADGTWTQKVPLVGLTPEFSGPLTIRKGTQALNFKVHDEFVPFSRQVTDEVRLEDSPLIFVGYGVQAPEYHWDDFKSVDVKGKTIIVLVNDPQVTRPGSTDLDPDTFGGKRMTYYGRWTYKYDKAAELGAAACIIVHETEYAGYPFNVVQGFGGERFDVVTPDKNMSRSKIESWMSLLAAKRLFAAAGLDFQQLKAQAMTRDFKPVALGMTASFSLIQKVRTIDSQNVIAKISGANPGLKREYVVYTAHWDHLGIGTPVNGDRIYHGARDNASGTAMLLEFAREFRKVRPAPKRTMLFIAVTGEEQGLLGSDYYATFPLYPLDKTLANINMDGINVWGRTKDFTVIGLGASDLDDYLRDAAAEQARTLSADAEPEKGFYYRSDHFSFAKRGVPALDTDSGIAFVGRPPGWGQEKRDEWTKKFYHQPTDTVQPWWDLSGAGEDGKLLFAVGYRVANADHYPEWKPGNEFRAIRDKALQGK